jgi:hypothetical protein
MPSYVQIEGDPTKWWIAEQLPTNELTGGQPLTVTSLAPIEGILVLSPRSATVAVFNVPSGSPPSPLGIPGEIIYVPTATGPSAGHVGYVLAGGVDTAGSVKPDRSVDAGRPAPDHRSGWRRRDAGAQRCDTGLRCTRPARGWRRDVPRMSGPARSRSPATGPHIRAPGRCCVVQPRQWRHGGADASWSPR